MKWKGIVISAVLQAQLPITGATPIPGLTDPRLCYILDGILFIYAVIITALFLKAKNFQVTFGSCPTFGLVFGLSSNIKNNASWPQPDSASFKQCSAKDLNSKGCRTRMTCIINCLVQPEMNMMFWERKREVLTLKWEGKISREERSLRTLFTLLCRRTRWARHTVKLGRKESTRGGEAKGMMASTRDSALQPRTHMMPSRCSRCPLTKWDAMGRQDQDQSRCFGGGEKGNHHQSKRESSVNAYFIRTANYFCMIHAQSRDNSGFNSLLSFPPQNYTISSFSM